MKNVIHKTYKESWFKIINVTTVYADKIFNEKSTIVVVQAMPCCDDCVIAELINKDDYMEYFKR